MKRQKANANKNPNNLPIPGNRLIGRRRERSRVKRLLLSARLVTLTGPGGCGKTRLALAVAHELVETSRFEHGVWFLDLAGLDTPGLIPQVIATTLGIAETQPRSLIEILTDFLERRTALLIFDNCEQLLPECTVPVRTLLDRCPQIRILATSREPLRLADEMIWLVPSLTLPDASQTPQFAEWAKSDAIQLFVARAEMALPEFALNETNAAAVEQICRRLDGIPLALELAAARLKMLDVAQIAARLEDSLQLLTRGGPGAVPRHQTMRAALDWSFALLQASEQRLFGRLSVFADGFTLEAAEEVCSDADSHTPTAAPQRIRRSDVLDLLANLVDKSLVQVAAREPEQAVRYRLLEPVRQYALDQLRAAKFETELRDRHLNYFTEFAEEAERQLKGANQLRWMTRLEQEHDNLRIALAWSTQSSSRTLTALRIAKAMHLFWQRRGYWSEGRRWLSQALANYQAHPEMHLPETDAYFARALVARSWLQLYEMDYPDTAADLEQALALTQASDDVVTLVFARGLMALLRGYTGDKSASNEFAVTCVETARRTNDDWARAWALYIRGWNAFYYLRDLQAAHAALSESEALFRATGDRRSIAVHVTLLGIMAMDANAGTAARAYFEEALAIGQELNDSDLQIKELANLALLDLLDGNTTEAEELFTRVLAQSREWNSKHWVAASLFGLAQVRVLRREYDAAEKLLREALPILLSEKRRVQIGLVLAALCRVMAARGQTLLAARVLGSVEVNLDIDTRNLVADDRILMEQNTAAVRSGLSPEEFNAARAAGRALPLEQAIEQLLDPGRATDTRVLPDARAKEMLSLYAFGGTRVLLGERVVTDWQYARVKELLFYLASHTGRTKAQIGLALWSEASPAQVRNSLGTGLYHLRRALGKSNWIVFEKDEYRLNRALDYRFDVETFESNLEQAALAQMTAPDLAVRRFEQALKVYAGDFVEDFLEGDWFLLRREELRRKYLDACVMLGRLCFARHEFERAAEAFRRAIEKDNFLEQAHRELMRSYARSGERGLAIRQYQLLEQIMHDEFGSPPAPESSMLFERLRRGDEI